jgi:hypothetical protein
MSIEGKDRPENVPGGELENIEVTELGDELEEVAGGGNQGCDCGCPCQPF